MSNQPSQVGQGDGAAVLSEQVRPPNPPGTGDTETVDRAALIERISRTEAANAAAHAGVLAGQDPSWGTEVFALADGQAVLCGPGLYVNRALAVGLRGPVTADDFDVLEERSAAVGVVPSIDVVPTAHRSVTDAGRGPVLRDLALPHDPRPRPPRRPGRGRQ